MTCDNDLTVPEPLPCFVPAGLRTWGWAAQLPSLHSDRSWGIGDLADLRRLARWSARLGAGALLVSPLHAPRQRLPQQSSPYSPSSRLWRNPLFIAVDEVPGFDRSLAPAPNPSGVRIDREGAWTAKMRALELLWARFPGDPAFDEFRERGGAALAAWAAFVLGDDDAHGQRSALLRDLSNFGQQAVEELVLGPLELGDRAEDGSSLAAHGVSVLLGLVVLAAGERRLRHQRAQAHVVGSIGEERQLLLHDPELGPRLLEAGRHLGQLPLDERP
ncbi:MAG: 4-alpha-glucanotransferase [Actinobacteria bacterium]|nr:MAG: 4-alpha-glucanotransferase [Actinomycetota bacterium]